MGVRAGAEGTGGTIPFALQHGLLNECELQEQGGCLGSPAGVGRPFVDELGIRIPAAVGLLAGGVAHDFSNVLAVVLGYSEPPIRDLPSSDPRLRECADGIIEAAHRAVGVTRQLLTLSRKKLLRPEVLSLNKVVQDLRGQMFRRILRLAGQRRRN